MDNTQFGMVSSIFTVGGLVGALAAGPVSSHRGRLFPMRLSAPLFIAGSALETLAPSVAILSIGRFLSGLAAGASIVIVPIYISEIVPTQMKGMFGASTQVGINMGILITQILGYFLSYGMMWRVVLGVGVILGVVQLLGMLGMVESPEWLGTKGRVKQAKEALIKIKGEATDEDLGKWGTGEDGREEYESLLGGPPDINSSLPHPRRTASDATIGIFQVVVHPDHYRAIIAVVAVMCAQQLSGINSVMMYSVDFLKDLLPTAAGLITVAVGVLNLFVTIACAPLSDKLGRKPCLLLSIAGMAINAFLLAFALMYDIQILGAVATLLFVASFAVGLGPVPFTLASELVGPEAVGATQSWALAANWIATFLVAQFFPILKNAMGKGHVFFVFTALGAVFFCFIAWWVPESKGKANADEVWGRERRED